MDDEGVITQLGLLLTQVRYARMALENVERATTRYAGLALTAPTAPGAAFGAPPLLDGALKVYIVNINELSSGAGGPGELLAGLLGGAGRFVSGLAGGFLGSFFTGFQLPKMLDQVQWITAAIERIMKMLGSSSSPDSLTFYQKLDKLLLLLPELRALMNTAAPEKPPQAPASGSPAELHLRMVTALGRVVNGLILLIPLLTGALAALLVTLAGIRSTVADLLQFALRTTLLLRGAVLAIVTDTVSLAAKLTIAVLGIVGPAINAVLGSLVAALRAALVSALNVLEIIGGGIKRTIDALLLFLRDGVGATLIFLGDLRIFRLIEYLVRMLPLILPAFAAAKSVKLSDQELKDLEAARKLTPAAGSNTPPPIAPILDLGATLLPKDSREKLMQEVTTLGETMRTESATTFNALKNAADQVATAAKQLVTKHEAGLDAKLKQVRKQAVTTTELLTKEQLAGWAKPDAGMAPIAKSYEEWLTKGGGLTIILAGITKYFEQTPVGVTAGAQSLPGRLVRTARDDAEPYVIVEIGEMVVEVAGSAPAGAPSGPPVPDRPYSSQEGRGSRALRREGIFHDAP